MFRQQTGWIWALLLAAAWLESCGAMTLEPGTPDEPVVAPRRAPRLVRRDAGSDAANNAEDNDP